MQKNKIAMWLGAGLIILIIASIWIAMLSTNRKLRLVGKKQAGIELETLVDKTQGLQENYQIMLKQIEAIEKLQSEIMVVKTSAGQTNLSAQTKEFFTSIKDDLLQLEYDLNKLDISNGGTNFYDAFLADFVNQKIRSEKRQKIVSQNAEIVSQYREHDQNLYGKDFLKGLNKFQSLLWSPPTKEKYQKIDEYIAKYPDSYCVLSTIGSFLRSFNEVSQNILFDRYYKFLKDNPKSVDMISTSNYMPALPHAIKRRIETLIKTKRNDEAEVLLADFVQNPGAWVDTGKSIVTVEEYAETLRKRMNDE